jgi:hypothetical protein
VDRVDYAGDIRDVTDDGLFVVDVGARVEHGRRVVLDPLTVAIVSAEVLEAIRARP